jgi:hypothetical protein
LVLKADKQLIVYFLAGYNHTTGQEYEVSEWPDHKEHRQPAIDAVARNAKEQTLAIEHTLIQPYEGEKTDTRILHQVFVPLEHDLTLRFQDYDIELYPKVGVIPKGLAFDKARNAVRQWVESRADEFPFGESTQRIDGLPIEVNVVVQKHETLLGQVFVGRSDMPNTLRNVIETALSRKLPKLASSEASGRVLLLEAESVQHSPGLIAQAIESLEPQFPLLSKIDEIWVADTASQESGQLCFCQIWPHGVTSRVYVCLKPHRIVLRPKEK